MTPRRKGATPKRWTGKAWAYWMAGAGRWYTCTQPPHRNEPPVLERKLFGRTRDRENWVRVRVTITPLPGRRTQGRK